MLGEVLVRYKKGPVPFPCLWLLAFEWWWGGGFWERAGECPVVCNWCVLKSLVLLCERTSPPGAHEVYVQNNKWQMNNHKLLFNLLSIDQGTYL